MENRLKCHATTCMYNVERLCGADVVRVEGGDTHDGDDTFCSTYTLRDAQGLVSDAGSVRLNGFVNNTQAGPCVPEPKIECSAVNCRYNEDRLCFADELKVIGEDSKGPKQTECITFNPRYSHMFKHPDGV